MAKSLYICYFGINQPLVQTQVLPYLRELQKDGHEITLLTFEPADITDERPDGAERIRKELLDQGIALHSLTYHKRPSAIATAWDVFCGAWFIWRRIAEFDILHCRVHVPMLMGAIARKFSRHKPKLLFDIRGFFPEEYVDAGLWKHNGPMFRIAKFVERHLVSAADGFVVLSYAARVIMGQLWSTKVERRVEARPATQKGVSAESHRRPIEVIPCCVDIDGRFSEQLETSRIEIRNRLNIQDRFVVVYLGAVGGPYLTQAIADVLTVARERNSTTFALFLSQSSPDQIEPLLVKGGFGPDDCFVGKVAPTDVSRYLAAGDVGLSFVKSGYAALSRSPTKIPEYLACGLPIIANTGVGDVDELITKNRIGALVDDFTTEAYLRALSEIDELGDVRDRCREVARREFDLETVGGVRYRRLYSNLLS